MSKLNVTTSPKDRDKVIDNFVQVTPNDLKDLEKAYNIAVFQNEESFMFREAELLTAYAKYLIEYLKTLKQK